MKPKLLIVKTPNKMLFIKGRLVRTPLETIVSYEEELNLLKSSMMNQSIEFDLQDYKPKDKKIKAIIVEPKKEIIPKKKKTPSTILEKIAANEDNE